MMNGAFLFLTFHFGLLITLCYQGGIIAESFRSDFPIIFYIYAGFLFFALSCLVDTINSTRLLRDDKKIARRADFCQICNRPKGIRTHHCQYCNKCTDRYFFHSTVLGTCISQNNTSSFVLYISIEIFFLLASFYLLIASFDYHNIFKSIIEHWAIIPMIPVTLYYIIQILIIIYFFIIMAKDNSCATENKKVGPFEVFKLLSNQANMFNRGVSSNLSELFAKLEEDDSLYKDNPKYYTYLREMGRLKDPENVNATPIL